MKKLFLAPLFLLSATTTFAADVFNGSQPIDCKPLQGHDCLPTEKTCSPLKPEAGKDLTLHFDVAKMSLKTPYRNDTLPIQSFGFNEESLVMQGTSLQLVWSATIHRTKGNLIVAIADRKGAYVVFGQCQVVSAKPPAK
jgi:hypothetical protein